MRSLARILVLAPAAALVVACAAPDLEPRESDDETAVDPARGAKPSSTAREGGAGEAGAAASCPYTGPPLDVSRFAACRDGGRCIPKAMIPPANLAQVQRELAACEGGFCAPEKMVKSQSLGLPTACTSIAGIEGRCTSTVILQVEANKDSIPRDVCDANERCTPCFDPLTGKETGACHQVSCDAAKTTFEPLPTCCKKGGTDKGLCFPLASLPTSAAKGLSQKECAATSDRCVPAEEMAAGFVHPKCRASNLIGSYDGVCISDCVKKDFLTGLATSQGSCGEDTFCAPCKNPLTGAPTGAPDCGP